MKRWVVAVAALTCLLGTSVGASGAAGEASRPSVMAAIIGNDGNNVLLGSAHRDRIEGLGGNDELRGARGDDRLYGGDGNDKLFAGKGSDSLYGGEGDDVLRTGPGGVDVLDGGPGTDTCYLDYPHQPFVSCEGISIP